MGIHDRDYYRENTGGFAFGRMSATAWFVVINSFVFLAQVLTTDARNRLLSPLVEYGAFDTVRIFHGEAWRLLTANFLHADLIHLAFNMLVLWWSGSRMEELYGRREFTLFYLVSGVFANLVQLGLQAAGVMPPSVALGASGCVMAVLVLYACHDPHQKILIFFVIPAPLWLCAILYVVIDLFGALGYGQRGIAHLVHLGGALFGFAYYRTGFRFRRLMPGMPSRSRSRVPALRVVHPDDDVENGSPEPPVYETPIQTNDPNEEPFETKVDRVLAKVSKHGQESLSPEEREILFRASEVYKKRRR
ncbi:MAG: rhomboid family intramembrane serine protease [Gemmataceae bacterium]